MVEKSDPEIKEPVTTEAKSKGAFYKYINAHPVRSVAIGVAILFATLIIGSLIAPDDDGSSYSTYDGSDETYVYSSDNYDSSTTFPTTTLKPESEGETRFLQRSVEAGIVAESYLATPASKELFLEEGYKFCEDTPADINDQEQLNWILDDLGEVYSTLLDGGDPVGDFNEQKTHYSIAIEELCAEKIPIRDKALAQALLIMTSNGKWPAGTYQAGTFVFGGEVKDCYWARLGNNGNIIANNFISYAPSVQVQISSSDAAFETEGCGSWRKVR